MKTFYAKTGDEWRDWLRLNHGLEQEVWLVFYRKGAGKPCIDFDSAIDWALCFGWIDSAIRRVDDLKYARRFTPRRHGSVWSKSNIERVEALIKEGRMTEYGIAVFRTEMISKNTKIK